VKLQIQHVEVTVILDPNSETAHLVNVDNVVGFLKIRDHYFDVLARIGVDVV
jgi:hypothetical protein